MMGRRQADGCSLAELAVVLASEFVKMGRHVWRLSGWWHVNFVNLLSLIGPPSSDLRTNTCNWQGIILLHKSEQSKFTHA